MRLDLSEAESPQGVAVLRTIAILRALQELQETHCREVFLREIAAATQLPLSTTHRFLKHMKRAQVVAQPEAFGAGDNSRGRYRFQWRVPDEPAHGGPAQGVSGLLVKLAGRTGQIALLYTPYALAEPPMRECTAHAWGSHAPINQTDVLLAPLGADAAGMALAAAMGMNSPHREQAAELRRIRDAGFAVGPSLLEGGKHDVIAAPVWRGSAAVGAVALMPPSVQMRSSKRRADLVSAVLDVSSAMSHHLTRHPIAHMPSQRAA